MTNSHLDRRHALGLPAGSVRALHVLIIVGITCAIIAWPGEQAVAIPAYLIYLIFLMLGHFFASHGVSIATRGSEQPSPLYLPGGTVRLLVILTLGAAIGTKLYQRPEIFQQQFDLSVRSLAEQPLVPVLILGGFFAGVMLRAVVGRAKPPMWLQDFEAWISIIALVGLGIAAMIHLIIVPSLEVPWLPLPTWEGILGAVIAFYFGERS
ncbi:MAG: hypothetical protein L0Y71_15965 [Gemmataceae bacterium]|nr:hypothetical protein [Gemmataceae bacterium]